MPHFRRSEKIPLNIAGQHTAKILKMIYGSIQEFLPESNPKLTFQSKSELERALVSQFQGLARAASISEKHE